MLQDVWKVFGAGREAEVWQDEALIQGVEQVAQSSGQVQLQSRHISEHLFSEAEASQSDTKRTDRHNRIDTERGREERESERERQTVTVTYIHTHTHTHT